MTAYVLACLATPAWWLPGLYRLDRRCAEGVGPSQRCHTEKMATLIVGPTPSADRRSPERRATAVVRTARPGGLPHVRSLVPYVGVEAVSLRQAFEATA